MRRFLLLFCALLFLSACAPKNLPLSADFEAASRWQKLQALCERPERYDVLSGSLRFGQAEDTQRVNYTLWSGFSDNRQKDLPATTSSKTAAEAQTRAIRLEITAGFGTNVASLLFDKEDFLILAHQEHTAFYGRESSQNLRKILGFSLPFTMQDLNRFLAGKYLSELDANLPEIYQSPKGNTIVYSIRAYGLPCTIELDEKGLPVRWEIDGSWNLQVSYDKDGLPRKLDGRLDSVTGEHRFVLLVKERRPSSILPMSSLELTVPRGMTLRSLD